MRAGQAILFLIAGWVFALPGSSAQASPITWDFAGEVTFVLDPANRLEGAVAVGSTFSGSYTFESTALDSDPRAERGVYAVSAFSGRVGELSYSLDSDGIIVVEDDFLSPTLDTYVAGGLVGFVGEEIFSAGFILLDDTGQVFDNDHLPVSLLTLDKFTFTQFSISIEAPDPSKDVFVGGEITQFVPEPSTLVLVTTCV